MSSKRESDLEHGKAKVCETNLLEEESIDTSRKSICLFRLSRYTRQTWKKNLDLWD